MTSPEPDGPRIIGAEFADRYGQRSARLQTGDSNEPCIICQHPTADCAEHREPVTQTYPTPAARPVYDNGPGAPSDGRVLRADEPFMPSGPSAEPVYGERFWHGSRRVSYELLMAPGVPPDPRFWAARNTAITGRPDVPVPDIPQESAAG